MGTERCQQLLTQACATRLRSMGQMFSWGKDLKADTRFEDAWKKKTARSQLLKTEIFAENFALLKTLQRDSFLMMGRGE